MKVGTSRSSNASIQRSGKSARIIQYVATFLAPYIQTCICASLYAHTVYTYMYICVYTCGCRITTHMIICAYVLMCTYMYTYMCIHIYVYVCIQVYICMYMYVYVCICMYVCICIYTYIRLHEHACIYIHTYTALSLLTSSCPCTCPAANELSYAFRAATAPSSSSRQRKAGP